MNRSKQLGEENIGKLLLKFSIPAIIGMIVNALYQIVDRIFIGKGVNSLALSGVAIIFPIAMVSLAFSFLVGIGASARISIKLGQNKNNEAEKILGNAVFLTTIISILITTIGLLFMDPILNAFGCTQETVVYAKDYLRIILYGTIFQHIGFGMNHSIRAEGNPKIAMITMLSGAIINTILDPIFIFVFDWGIKGAAWATVLAQLFNSIWVLSYFLGGKSVLKIKLQNLKLDLNIIKQIFAIGMSPFFMQLAASAVGVILNRNLVFYGGDLAVAAFGIINPLIMLILMPIFGLNQGSQPIIGYNFGAEKFERVKNTLKLSIITATIISIFGFALFQIFSKKIISLFCQNDIKLISLGTNAMRIYTIMLPIIGFQVVSSNYFQAVNKALISAFLALLRQVIILIPLLIFLPPIFKLNGVWIANPLSDLISSVVTALFIFREIRLLNLQSKNKVIRKTAIQ